MKHSIILDSGLKGWRGFLRENYSDFEQLLSYEATYQIGTRLLATQLHPVENPDEDDLLELYERNPLCQGGIKPEDLRVCKASEYTVADLHRACFNAELVARQHWRRETWSVVEGYLVSRGRWLHFELEGGEAFYEGEARRWDGTKGDLLDAQRAATGSMGRDVVLVGIFGGFDLTTSPRAYRDGDYEPLVAEWSLGLTGPIA